MLVQYGMMRAGGLRTIELQAEIDARRRQIDESHAEATRLKDRLARESSELARKVREYELESEGLRVENAALREKVRALELLTRNAVTTETIDRKYEEVMDQMRRVDRLVALHDVGTPPTPDH
jgi:predicted nuclease with TOPRIM domain